MTYDHLMTNKEAIEELKNVSTIDMPIRLCEAYYMSLKALEQEPKTGHWIKEYKKSIFTTMYRCSECAILCGNNTFNYCPNCGARMFEPKESEDEE